MLDLQQPDKPETRQQNEATTMSGAEQQRSKRVAMVIRQALLMIVAVIEKEFGITSKTGGRIRVEFVSGNQQEEETG